MVCDRERERRKGRGGEREWVCTRLDSIWVENDLFPHGIISILSLLWETVIYTHIIFSLKALPIPSLKLLP